METRNIIFIASICVVILGLAIYGYFNATPPGDQTAGTPRIEISPVFFDFGEVEHGEVLEHSFLVKNSGQGTLEIKKVATSCACTTAEVVKEMLGAGEETNLLVRYDSGAMSGPHGRGQQERIIYIKTSDPVTPQVEVKITALVE